MSTTIDLESLVSEIGKCCLSTENCGTCNKEKCLIGYCKKSLLTTLKQQDEFIDGGLSSMPYNDTKLYEEEIIITSIASLLNQCRNCNLYHDEDCIINIVRSALEIIVLGEPQEYRGSTLFYLSDIKNVNPQVADQIYNSFKNKKQ